MKREARVPRIDWPRKVGDLGFAFHTFDGEVYWDERAAYRFSAEEVDTLEAATAELHARCLDAVGHVVERGDYERLRIPAAFHGYIDRSWRDAQPSLYGRMDLSWDATGEPKLLEYKADTPTALLEDQGTVDYLRDTAQQAGLTPLAIDIADIGWDGRRFVDLDGRRCERSSSSIRGNGCCARLSVPTCSRRPWA
jgi:glutathionylspermidine synthase